MNKRVSQKGIIKMMQGFFSVHFCRVVFFRIFIFFSFLFSSFCVLPHAFALSTQSASPALITNGLVGWWTFDGKYLNTSTSTDSSGRGNNGDIINGATPLLGKNGQALLLNGSNQYIQIPSSSSLNVSTNFSITAWVKISTNKDYNQIFMRNNANSDFYGLITDVNGSLAIQVGAGGVFCVPLSTTKLSAGVWYHVAGTYNAALGSANCKLYINGVQDATTGTFASGVGSGANSQNATIGYDLPNGRPFAGVLDDVRLYNRTLSTSEIATLAGVRVKTVSTDASGLVGYWSFDQGRVSESTVKDLSPYNNNATLTNSPTPITGKVGQAYNFLRASSQYASAPPSASLNGVSGANTVAAWVYPRSEQTWTALFSQRSSCSNNFGIQVYSYDGTGCPANNEMAYQLTDAGGTSYALCAPRLPLNQWTHLVGTYDGSTMSVYQNGSLSTSTSIGSITLRTASVPTYIGYDSCNNNHFDGRIDEARLYNRSLSSAEVVSLYKTKNSKLAYGVSASSTIPFTNGLVVYHTFDGKNMTSSTSTDSGGQGNNGALQGGPTVTLGRIGQGLSLNGTTQFVDLGTINPIPNGVGTIALWFKLNPGGITGSPNNYLLAKGNDDVGNQNIGLDIIASGSTTAGIYLLYGSATWANKTGVSMKLLQWNHVAVVMKSGNQQDFYVNGVYIGSDTKTTITPTAGLSLYLGKQARADPNGYYTNGAIDDVRIYNRALSAIEINALYKLGGR